MRQRLLDATVECLVEVGWSGTSTTLVSQRAGVSRGAQLHHFPTKNDLVLAAVEHLSDARREELRAAAAELPTGRRRTRAVLEMLADALHRPGVLRRARAVGRGPHRRRAPRRPSARSSSGSAARRTARTVELLGFDESRARRPRAGAGHPRPGPRARAGEHDHRRHRPPQPDPRRSGRGVLDAQVAAPMNDRLAAVLADLRAEGDQLEDLVAPLPTSRAGAPRRRPPGWDVAHQVAHLAWTDEAAVAAATDKAAWDALVLAALADPDGFVDAEAARGRRRTAGRAAGPLAAGRGPRWPRRWPRCRRAPGCRGTARR